MKLVQWDNHLFISKTEGLKMALVGEVFIQSQLRRGEISTLVNFGLGLVLIKIGKEVDFVVPV